MKTTYKNRPVELEIELGRHSACDSFISSGNYTDGAQEDLSDTELEELTDLLSDEICESDMEFYGYFRD
jgi:hypothetical protein